ncbi:hypothetical protein HUT16_10300 [Kitasatospora sp. NA04385]|nr:hypothetical protein [Kitasatospora sp. NA04385]QKW19410.1 hypothetical protein HUT16_10300 [Kitasatospora sp. NA04385]
MSTDFPQARIALGLRLRAQRTTRPGSRAYLSAPWPADGVASTTSLSPE